ncbi:MAG: hypothetical protein GF311_12120 [Candidatus Lokiarchaeota archaeon]|nr:hypothetical protein [Candidatus Lokiarchaeota archaeon]
MNLKIKAYRHYCNNLLKKNSNPLIINLIEYSNKAMKGFLENRNFHINFCPWREKSFILGIEKWISNGKSFIKYNDKLFNKINKNPIQFGYRYIIYSFKKKNAPNKELVYIGYTKHLERRLKNHIFDSLESSSYENKPRYLVDAIKKEIISEFPKIEIILTQSYPNLKINDVYEIYDFIKKNKGSELSKKIYLLLKEIVFKKKFTLKILELHRNRRSALNREKYLIKNYTHIIKNSVKKGTIWPNGFNMKSGGGGGSQKNYHVPIYDYVGLVSLGLKHEAIIKILNKSYKRKYPSSTVSESISEYFSSYRDLQSQILKPVIELLIKDNKIITLQEISSILDWDPKTLGIKIKKWYNGNGFKDLRLLMKARIEDWDNLNHNSSEIAKSLRGYTRNQWKKWLINSSKEFTMEKLAKKLHLSKHYLYKKDFVSALSRVLIGSEILSLNELKRELKILTTIKLLRQSEDPKDILEYHFCIKYKSPSQLKSFYNRIFKTRGISFFDIIEKYSDKSEKIQKKYFKRY